MHVQVPIDDFFITWVIIGTFSAWGGLVRYIVDQNNEYEEWCNERCNSDPHPTPEIRSRG
ncbi:hypothetical protein CH56_2082 [Yersinia pestis Angola]|nr:hypothetical protein CH56_2082 [Yersinia pestis Angola]